MTKKKGPQIPGTLQNGKAMRLEWSKMVGVREKKRANIR